ncbi:C6 transcription factor [Penicillium macrosclerotiorum]|uniref:C6 transcription factor n=1 Tax=Penicillium macrosclerotiorum TaxID=303699 RepID=UPI0025472074|nr:C6 transcription factor [Penicillium macrosclerotiorum]KAJ5679644.1 C6 transcription factor [Penicillium macrosclerotiorum]
MQSGLPRGFHQAADLTAPGPVRQRSRQACLPCRQRKRKCDGKLPCNVCQGYDYECEYENGPSKVSSKRALSSEGSPSQSATKMARVTPSQGISKPSTNSTILPGVVEPSKARYVGRYSSVAFPLYVGLEVQATKLPRLHSFAYHAGIRKEPPCAVSRKLVDKVPWNTARSLIEVYTAMLHPIFGFLDIHLLYTQCEEHWHGQPHDMVFEAMVSGVLALASLFNGDLDQEMEMWLTLHAKEILEDCAISRYPSLEQIAAWILRTIYIRCTGRPHVTWLSSCTIMHLVEAIGLHHAAEHVMQTTGNVVPTPAVPNTVTRTAQVAHCLHVLIAFEYGRSTMATGRQNLEVIEHITGGSDLTPQLCSLVACVPINLVPGADVSFIADELISALEAITDINVDHDFLILLRADLALGIYRHLRVMDINIRHEQKDRVVSAGMHALPAARRLASQHQPWWNVIGTVFQFTCALLVLDTVSTCEKLVEAMDTLELIVDRLNSHLAKEALSTARQLVRASLDKKRKGVHYLEQIVGPVPPVTAPGEIEPHISQDGASLSPSFAPQLPLDFESLWAMEFQLPL